MVKLFLETILVVAIGWISCGVFKKFGFDMNFKRRLLILIPTILLCMVSFSEELKDLFFNKKEIHTVLEKVRFDDEYWIDTPHEFYTLYIKDTLTIPVVLESNGKILNKYLPENIEATLVNPKEYISSHYTCDNAVLVIEEKVLDNYKEFTVLGVKKGETAIQFKSEVGSTFVIVSVE